MSDDAESLKLAQQLQAAEDAEARHMQENQFRDDENDRVLAEMLAQELNAERVTGSSSNFSTGQGGPIPSSQAQSQSLGTDSGSGSRSGPQEVDTRGGCRRFKNMRAGDDIIIRLHHPHSGSHIGESLRAQYLSTSEVRFELVNDPGKFLLVSDTGKVEFKQCLANDVYSRYRFELTLNDRVYLKCSGHINKLNIVGETCWFLALTSDGHLIGNSNRGPAAQWSLVASEGQHEIRATSMGSSLSSSSTTSSSSSFSDRLSAYNPFGKPVRSAAAISDDANTYESVKEADKELADEELADAHLNPLLFQDVGSLSALPTPPPAYESGIRNCPKYSAFLAVLATLSPGLAAAVEVEPSAFVLAIQSPELWALLDALPSQISDTADSTTNSNSSSHSSVEGVEKKEEEEEEDEFLDNEDGDAIICLKRVVKRNATGGSRSFGGPAVVPIQLMSSEPEPVEIAPKKYNSGENVNVPHFDSL